MATTTYEPIQTYTLSSDQATVTFSSIPSTYTDLILVSKASHTGGSAASLMLRFNGDTASNYSMTRIYGDGSSAASDRGTSDTAGPVAIIGNQAVTSAGTFITQIQNYSNNTTYKTTISRGSDSSGGYVSAYTMLWRGTPAAISSIEIKSGSTGSFSSLRSGSTFTLYGIANAPAWVAKATGGTITNDVSYTYHTFTSSGTFTPLQNLDVDYLVIAGGGAGGGNKWGRGSGGGGAGGFRTSIGGTPLSLTAQAYTAIVGAGGATNNNLAPNSSASTTTVSGGKGQNSIFASITATGGGGGGSGGLGSIGGSGGGNGEFQNNAGITGNEGGYTPVEGYAGGSVTSDYGASGGGGAGGIGVNRTSNNSTAGGPGRSSSINGSVVTYAGGGGGGNDYDSGGRSAGAGGTGGGGAGAQDTSNAGAGAVNTGSGGGGGAGNGGTGGQSGAGGSGIVIVRYAN